MTGFRDWPKILGVSVFAVALWAQPAALVGAFYDDGIYAVLAKSLAEGHGYRYIHLPGAPPAVHYPFLYPAVLSLLWRLWPAFPENVALFQLFDSACLGAAAWLIARHLEDVDAPAIARFIMLPLAFAAFPLLTIVGVRFSEPMFLALAAATLLLADRPGSSWNGWVTGLLAGLAILTRSVGVAIAAGAVAACWWKGKRREALQVAMVAAIVSAPWFLWVSAHSSEVSPLLAANYGTYIGEARQAGLGAILAGLDLRALGPPALLAVGFSSPVVRWPLQLLLAGALVWGGIRLLPRAPTLVLALAGYVLLVSVWPYAPDRFMWIVLPWLATLVGVGLVQAWWHNPPARWGAIVLAAGIAAGYLPREILALKRRSFAATAEGISQPSRILVPAIQSGTAPDAIIAAEGEAGIFLYTGRLAVPNNLFRWQGRGTEPIPVDTVRRFICDSHVTYVSLSGPHSDGEPVVNAMKAAGEARRLFQVTSGPSLHGIRCPA